MKRLLITGANSYIGTSFADYMNRNFPEALQIDILDMLDEHWKETDFSGYDAIFHVAGIAHADVSNVSKETERLYYRVNTDLAIATAKKAKEDGAGQFIFMSSMIVYGGEEHITAQTQPSPANFYGDSKWQADKGVRELEDTHFRVAVLRPPMIYGKGSKGNYPVLAKLATKLPVFPKVSNRRSMLYIENLCEFLRIVIEKELSGVFFPQNDELVNTSTLVRIIAKAKNKRTHVTCVLTPFVTLGRHIPGKIGNLCRKAFGSSYYDMDMSEIGYPYRVAGLEESIQRTEGR